jgi:hypothetical protein
MFNRRRIRELEHRCYFLTEERAELKKEIERLKEEAKKLTEAKKPPVEINAGGLYDLLRENGVEIIAMNRTVNPWAKEDVYAEFTVKQALKYKDLREIIHNAKCEMFNFSVVEGLIYFSVQPPEADKGILP